MNYAQLVIAIPRRVMPGGVIHPSRQEVEESAISRLVAAIGRLVRRAFPAVR